MERETLQAELNAVLTEIKGQLDAGRNASSRMEAMDAQYVEVKAALDALDGRIQALSVPAPAPKPYVSVAQQIATKACLDENFQNFVHRKGQNPSAMSVGMDTGFDSPFGNVETKAAVANANYGYQATSTQSSDVRRVIGVANEQTIDREDQKPLTVWDLITKVNDPAPFYQWVKETGRTKGAAGRAEGTAKPNSALVVATQTSEAVTIPTYMKVSRQVLQDIDEMENFVRDILMNSVEERLEDQIMYGDGDTASGNLQGIMTNSGIQTQAFTTNVYDSVRSAIRKLRVSYRAEPNHLVINHDDHYNMDTLKAGDGHYLWVDSGRTAIGGPVDALWRVPLVPGNTIASGYGLLGNFNLGTQIRIVSPMQLFMTYTDQDDFIKNLVTFLTEIRLHFIVKRPARFVKVGLISGY